MQNSENKINIKIKKLDPNANIPTYAYQGDAGADLYAVEDISIPAFGRALVSTGVALAIPDGFVGLIWDKSSIPTKFGITTMAGVVDAGYRGEIKVLLQNTTDKEYKIQKGNKIAQILFQKVYKADFKQTNTLPDSQRGSNAFGSSGLQK